MFQKIILLFLPALFQPLIQAQCTYTDTYSSSAGWKMNGTGYFINSAFDFNYTQCTYYNYATHSLGGVLSDKAWTADIEFMYSDRGWGGVGHVLLGVTSDTLNSWNNGSAYAVSNEDAIDAYIVCPYSAPQNNDSLYGRSKDGTNWNKASKGIAIKFSTQYYIRLQRISPTMGRINLFLDQARTIHASGSPQDFPVTCSVKGLTYVEHGCIPQGWWTRQLRGTVDNLNIRDDTSALAPSFYTSIHAQNISCSGMNNGSISLNQVGGSAPFSYYWSNGLNGVGLNSASGLSPDSYYIFISDNAGCNEMISVIITEPPPIRILLKSTSDCSGRNPSYIQAFVAGGIEPYHYNWSTYPAQNGTIITGLTAGIYTLTVIDSNQCGKEAIDTVFHSESLPDFESLETVTIFTPNNDGKNDEFFPFNYQDKDVFAFNSAIDTYHLYVYDRWGKLVFNTTGVSDTWKGKELNGNNASDGVYYWTTEFKLNKCLGMISRVYKGFVHLQR